MRTGGVLLLIALLFGAYAMFSKEGALVSSEASEAIARANDYFRDYSPNYDRDLYRVAAAIGAGRVPTAEEIAAVKSKINERAKDDITLLFFAGWSAAKVTYGSPAYLANLEAIDLLLRSGADPYAFDRLADPRYTLISSATSSPLPIAADITRIYLKDGGDPNHLDTDNHYDRDPILEYTVTVDNFETYKLLVDAGADVFKRGPNSSAMSAMDAAGSLKKFNYIEYAVSKGKFANVDDETMARAIQSLDTYWLRDDDISRDIVRMTRMVLAASGYRGDATTEKILSFGAAHGW